MTTYPTSRTVHGEELRHRTWMHCGTVAALIGVGLLSGCGGDDPADNTAEPTPLVDSGLDDFGGEDSGTAEPLDAGTPETPPDPDAGLEPDPDGGAGPDGGAELDGGVDPDAGQVPPECDPDEGATASGTLAFYGFDSEADVDVAQDATGAYPGNVHGAIARTAGRDDCGQALDFATAHPDAASWNVVEVPHTSAWDLPEGSVDFWLRLDSLPERGAGLISRDASQIRQAGHLTFLVNAEGRLVVRLQRMGTDNNDRVFLCSDAPVELSTWTHVEFRFGRPYAQLFIDGAPSTYDQETLTGLGGTDMSATCGGLWIDGIAGNENPWVIGAATVISAEGSATPLSLPFRHGAIDDVRIRGPRSNGQ